MLFRSNSVAMKLVSAYGKLIGYNYLAETLGPIVKEIIMDSSPVEVSL